jgi:(1->4)-alpha-D-glucan 1-alpha-D-glucosylmutase
MHQEFPEHLPRATYRVQLNRSFTFRDAEQITPYLARLGISDLYCSPFLKAKPGSPHGYDITDPSCLNPEIGHEAEYRALTAALQGHGMGQLLDIVPNHMGIAARENPWWADVLENGPSARHAPFFDIDWHPLQPGLQGKVLLPVLGDQYGIVLERGELVLRYEAGRFWIDYFDQRFPVAPRPSAGVLAIALDELGGPGGEEPERMELESILTALRTLPTRDRMDAASAAERRRERTVAGRRLEALCSEAPHVREAIDRAVALYNGAPGEPSSFDRLDALLDDQAYRLADWRVAAEQINYRRFFDINELAGVRIERPEVFQAMHGLILRLLGEGGVTGVRVDHPDGLYDPRGYFRQLREASERAMGGRRLYLVIEKILTGAEALPADWPVDGTVGYDFLNRVNGLFVQRSNAEAMSAAYTAFIGLRPDYRELVYSRKRLVLRDALVSELTVLAYRLSQLAAENRRVRDFTLGTLSHALRETIACFPVYRTYLDAEAGSVDERDRAYIEQAVRAARRRNPSTSASVFDFLRRTLLLDWPEALSAEARAEHAHFVMKVQQLTGPVMAKGVEDTSFYLYNRLVSLNEVGGEPERFGVEQAEFHAWIQERARAWPHTMNTLSTHDTKRSADVRARINSLSEIPERWAETARRWAAMNARFKRASEEGRPIPDANDEYLLYQTLLGVWPLEEPDAEGYGALVERVQRYMEKASREAKLHTSWISPDDEYDQALASFVGAVLDRSGSAEFLDDFTAFQREIAGYGMLNSLAQMLLLLAAPGVPDLYQGQELWDFSLVDPDNRRPVDYALRERLLSALETRLASGERRVLLAELLASWRDGRIKLFLTLTALAHRRAHPGLYAAGEYHPLAAEGARGEHVVAFARTRGEERVLVVVPRLVASLYGAEGFRAGGEVWGDTALIGDARLLAGRWLDVLSGEPVEIEAGPGEAARVPIARVLGRFPVAMLEAVK